MIMGNFKKVYVGAIESEREAAYLYDKIAIIIHGLKVTQTLTDSFIGQNKFLLHKAWHHRVLIIFRELVRTSRSWLTIKHRENILISL